MNNETKKRYWLRGGIIAVCFIFFYAIIIIVSAYLIPIFDQNNSFIVNLTNILGIVGIPLIILLLPGGIYLYPEGQSMVMAWIKVILSELLILTIIFLIGVAFGWLYGKIKRKI